MTMKFYKQSDPRWSAIKMGSSSCTLGRFGCTTTAICMLMSRFYSTVTPGEAAKSFSYNADGLIEWAKCDFGPLKFIARVNAYEDKRLREWLKDPNNCAIIQVRNKYIPFHWVAADRFSIIGLNIVDPIDAKPYRMASKYEPYGVAYFTFKK